MLKRHAVFLFGLLVFGVLLARNPFSARTLIPNLEPYPDTIHYLSPASNFAAGHGFSLWREGRSFNTWVPPLYSAIMIPAFQVHNDVRMFYFVNVLLALASLAFLYLILRKITENKLLQGFVLFLYATNYFNYWYPTLAMGENLVIPLFLSSVWLLTGKASRKNMVLIAIASVSIYATKTANLPITLGLVAGYCYKLYLEQKGSRRLREMGAMVLFFTFAFIAFSVYFQIRYGFSVLSSLFFFIGNLFPSIKSSSPSAQAAGQGWFSMQYMYANLPVYLRAMLGGYPVRFLWDNTPIVPLYIGIPGIAGLIAACLSKKFRVYGVTLFLILLGSIVFMSTFYSADMRYLYQAIPILLIGFAFFFRQLYSIKKSGKAITALLLLIFVFYAGTNAVRLKKQTMLNLKYSESPWYYLSVEKLNGYFASVQKNKPYVITAMTPYYVDFFSNGNYTLLPMSKSQDFFTINKTVWGSYDYGNLHKTYVKLLDRGNDVYLLNYLGNESNISSDFSGIKTNFNLKKVAEGCYGSCDIYKLTVK